VITLVPLFRVWSFAIAEPVLLGGYLVVLILAFILHEFAHKFEAQRLGMWAEFRLSTLGLILTLLSFLLVQASGFPLMVIAPGAVMIAGKLNRNDYGRISVAGPATNIAQAVLFFIGFLLTYMSVWGQIFLIGMEVNSGLALFNLIPFGVFDGLKIYKWNKSVWVVTLVAAVLIFLYAIFGT
jgi:Zn-dependent protease